MACERVALPGGGSAIVCGTRRRQRRTISPAADKDLCSTHAAAFAEWQAARRAVPAAAAANYERNPH